MNIAIIEKGHFEVAYTLLSLFDNGNNNIIVYIDRASHKQLELMLQDKMQRFNWVVQQPDETNRQFIYRIFQLLKRQPFDLIYFDTIEDNFIVYAWFLKQLKTKRIILTLHDINGFFQYQPAFSIRRLVRYLGKRMLIRILPAFNVLSETLIPQLSLKLTASKKIFNIAGSCFKQEHYVSSSYLPGETIKITIPGSVDERRRNYEIIFDLLLVAKQRNIKISITLLGSFQKGNSENILERCQDYLKTNNNLNIFRSSIVDQPEFDKVIRDSHFIWTPLHQYSTIADGVTEEYGKSTCSGNIADSIKHAKPFFSPAHLAVDSALENGCIRYSTIDELADFLNQLTRDSYDSLQKKAYRASLHYTKDNIINRNAELFSENKVPISTP